jgi:PEP-CTERM motif
LSVGVGEARAGFTQLTTPSQLNPADITPIYAGVDGSRAASPVTLVAGSNQVTISDSPTVGFLRADQGATWQGGFASSTKLLWDVNSTGTAYGGPVTVAFATGVSEAGFQIQQSDPVSTTFTATVYEGSTSGLVFTVTVPGYTTGGGTVGFIGVKATGSDFITSIVVSSVDSSNTQYNNDFAIGPVTVGGQAVPEPSSMILMGLGLASAVSFGCRRLTRKTV